jgi:hypothetical protein
MPFLLTAATCTTSELEDLQARGKFLEPSSTALIKESATNQSKQLLATSETKQLFASSKPVQTQEADLLNQNAKRLLDFGFDLSKFSSHSLNRVNLRK